MPTLVLRLLEPTKGAPARRGWMIADATLAAATPAETEISSGQRDHETAG